MPLPVGLMDALKAQPLTVWVVPRAPRRYVRSHPRTGVEAGFNSSKIVDPNSSETQPSPSFDEAREPLAERLKSEFRSSFSGSDATFRLVFSDELSDELSKTQGTEKYPDAIVGWPLPMQWRSAASRVGVAMLGTRGVVAEEENAPVFINYVNSPDAAILLDAPHPEAARAFIGWLTELRGRLQFVRRRTTGDITAPVDTAIRAVGDLLNGGSGGERDPDEADFSGVVARTLLFGNVPDLVFSTDVLFADANEHLAVVALRVIANSNRAFGIVHPLVVLRRTQDGQWKVLQITSNLALDLQERAVGWIDPYTSPTKQHTSKPIAGISQAAPLDGDIRQPRPELWWDNSGDGSLLIVEWQRSVGSKWTDSKMFFVGDSAPRVQTRVRAEFADIPGAYHWRVWTVGAGGALTISPWRTLNIYPQR